MGLRTTRRTTASIFGAYPAGRLLQREPGDWRVEVRVTPGFAMFYAGASMLAFEMAVVSHSIVVWSFALLTLLAGANNLARATMGTHGRVNAAHPQLIIIVTVMQNAASA